MNKQSPFNPRLALLGLLIFGLGIGLASAQINVNKLKDKASEKVSPKKNDNKGNQDDTQNKPKNEGTTESKPEQSAAAKSNLLEEIKKEQQEIVAKNRIVTDKNSVDYAAVDLPAHLSFTNNYNKKDANMQAFTGKDFIYARLHLEKPLAALMPDNESDYGLQYYRVKIHVKTAEQSGTSELKLRKMDHFKLAYGKTDLMLAIVPERGFYESILESYKKEGKSKVEGYNDILARNFSGMVSNTLKQLSPGEHRVEIEFDVMAKLKSDQYFKLTNMKGVFMLTIDDEAKKRYEELQPMLGELYKEYEAAESIAEQTASLEAEEAMLNNLSPREKERYLIAKKSPGGYMAAYDGPKADVSFVFDQYRDKNAYMTVIWPAGSCDKCEAGTADISAWQNSASTYQIPIGATVKMNGNELIPKVSGKQTVTIYWWY